MTVGTSSQNEGELNEVVSETPSEDGSSQILFLTRKGRISSDLRIGADVSSVLPLTSNDGLTTMGMMLAGSGFIVSAEEAVVLRKSLPVSQRVLLEIKNGRDLVDEPRQSHVIDFCGLTSDEARILFPELFNVILTRVKPERDRSRDSGFRDYWWLFGRTRPEFRKMTASLSRYVTTGETAKHRIFQFLKSDILPDHSIIAFGIDDAYHLGVLSSRIHLLFALATGGTLEDRPRYNKTRCFDPFPFPDCTASQRDRIRKIAEELDGHRKRVQAQHAGLTLTGMYNVLEKLRSGEALTPKERDIHDKGLVSVLKQLHDDLDAAVFDAYGWPRTLTDAEILERLVALNAERAREEAAGHIRWLRPEYQIPLFQKQKGGAELKLDAAAAGASAADSAGAVKPKGLKAKPKADGNGAPAERKVKAKKLPWPKTLPDRAKAVESVLRGASAPVKAAEVAGFFRKGKKDPLPEIAEILETLCTFGRARRWKDGESFTA
jgi:hypothetical protein